MADLKVLSSNAGVDWFTYSTTFSSLAANTSAQQSITIQAESDFLLTKLVYFADIAGGAQTQSSRVIPLASLLIVDASSGYQLMDNPIPLDNLAGSGGLPFILPGGRIFRSRTSINLTLSNFSAATAYNIRLGLIGVRLFEKTAP